MSIENEDKMNNTSKSIELDLSQIFMTVWERKNIVVVITGVFAILSVIYSLSLPNYFKSSSILELSGGTNTISAGSGSAYSGLAALAGINISKVSISDKAMIAKQTILSRDFFRHIMNFDGVLEGVIATKAYNKETKEIIYDSNLFDVESGWQATDDNGNQAVMSFLDAHKSFTSLVDIFLDFDTGLLTISVEHKSPEFAYYLTDLIINELNNLERNRDIAQAMRAIEFLNEQLEVNKYADVRLSINRLIQSQLETQMLANVRQDYLLYQLDTPYIPEKKSRPRRSLICIFGTFFGLLLSIIYCLVDGFVIRKSR